MLLEHTHSVPDRASVLSRATLRAAARLGVSARILAQVIGVSEPSVSRMKKGEFALEDGSKAFELAAVFVRVFRSLDAITGGDEATARAWMGAQNTVLAGRPIDRITTITGLTDVAAYLDARRAVI
jgi:predicted transcriptional regulator